MCSSCSSAMLCFEKSVPFAEEVDLVIFHKSCHDGFGTLEFSLTLILFRSCLVCLEGKRASKCHITIDSSSEIKPNTFQHPTQKVTSTLLPIQSLFWTNTIDSSSHSECTSQHHNECTSQRNSECECTLQLVPGYLSQSTLVIVISPNGFALLLAFPVCTVVVCQVDLLTHRL